MVRIAHSPLSFSKNYFAYCLEHRQLRFRLHALRFYHYLNASWHSVELYLVFYLQGYQFLNYSLGHLQNEHKFRL